ncbi:hypothetical protein OLMES_3928 [Oleiphilus messinensis]|uniref:DUF4214 domain-containing protein n=2 Tax=Oleiphilus messinensis TaxID=141451 RepID=A0A1Y0IBQ0_9GAMM|nr:hypothetical protein OLMES_3928 [Oleiphilus messinensis]
MNHADTVQLMYIAYYGRPADAEGLEFWAQELENVDGNIEALIDAFGDSVEYTERYGDLNNEALITGIYQQLFNRDPDEGGLKFYTQLLDEGAQSLSSIAIDVLNGSTGEDEIIIDNKLTVAKAFTGMIAINNVPYQSEELINSAKDLLSQVDATEAQVESIVKQVFSLLGSIVNIPIDHGDIDVDIDFDFDINSADIITDCFSSDNRVSISLIGTDDTTVECPGAEIGLV